MRQDLAVPPDSESADTFGDYDPGYGPLVSTRVRIGTWNLWGRYGPWAQRLGPIEANMRGVGADIWALQEVWTHDVRVLPRVAGDARDDEGEERLVVFAEIDGPRGPIQVYCAHLSWRDDHSAIRQDQVAEICRLVREHRPRTFPAVLCGDLYADPTSDEVRMLTGHAAVPVPGV